MRLTFRVLRKGHKPDGKLRRAWSSVINAARRSFTTRETPVIRLGEPLRKQPYVKTHDLPNSRDYATPPPGSVDEQMKAFSATATGKPYGVSSTDDPTNPIGAIPRGHLGGSIASDSPYRRSDLGISHVPPLGPVTAKDICAAPKATADSDPKPEKSDADHEPTASASACASGRSDLEPTAFADLDCKADQGHPYERPRLVDHGMMPTATDDSSVLNRKVLAHIA